MYKVTIGIAVYNAEQYLPQTMESALNQTFDSINYLIVDDCGNDRSMDHIHTLQKQHPRGKDIRIVRHNGNKGISEARNTILKEMNSDYLFYLDSDDLITPDCIDTLYKAIIRADADVVYGSHLETWESKRMEDKKHILSPTVFDREDQFAAFTFGSASFNLRTFVWNMLFKCSFLKEHRFTFENVKVWEDLLFTYDYIPHVRKAVFCSEVTYIYLKRDGSLSQYNSRKEIPCHEISEHIRIRNMCKAKCLQQLGKPYFGKMMIKTMSICYDAFMVMLDKRKQITPPIPNKKLNGLISYPLSLGQTCRLKHQRVANLILFLIGRLPFCIAKPLFIFGRELIVLYRKKPI